MFIIGWVPVRVEHDQSVGTNEIEATSSSFAAQHEDKVGGLERKEVGEKTLQLEVKSYSDSQLFSPKLVILSSLISCKPVSWIATTNQKNGSREPGSKVSGLFDSWAAPSFDQETMRLRNGT